MELNRKQIIKILLIITISIMIFFVVQNLNGVVAFLGGILTLLTPFIVGLCIAFILNIPMRFFETRVFGSFGKGKHGKLWNQVRRPFCLLISILLVLLILTVFTLLIVPEIRDTIILIIDRLPSQVEAVVQSFRAWIQSLGINPSYVESLNIDWNSIGSELLKLFSDGGSMVIGSTISLTSSLIGNVVNTVLGFVFAIYVLLAKERLAVQLKKIAYALLPEKNASKIFHVAGMSSGIFSKFVIGQCTEAVILGVLCYIGMRIFSFPYAMMISSLIAITALIPVFGAFIGTGIGIILIFFQSPIQALWFLIFMIVLQQLEGNIIYPKVVGDSVGLPGIWVLFAVTIGGNLLGAVGMLVSVPLCALLYCLIREGIHALLKQKNIRKTLYEG